MRLFERDRRDFSHGCIRVEQPVALAVFVMQGMPGGTADRIRQMIFTGQIKPGELLPTRKELAAQFGVGIATVHEAIKSLGAVGLVESRPGKGTWVSHNALQSVIHPAMILNRFGPIDVYAVYEARMALEVALAELAAEKATPQEIEQMMAHLEAAQKVIDDDDEFVRVDWDFHMTVANATHNILLQAFSHLSRELLARGGAYVSA